MIVCDAGGGTVVSLRPHNSLKNFSDQFSQDIITYRVKQAEPLIFEEATEGTGMNRNMAVCCAANTYRCCLWLSDAR